MKKILKALLLVMLGLIIGFVLGSLNSYRAISWMASNALFDMANDVHQLQQGRSDSVLERKRSALPGLVQQFESNFRKFLSEKQGNSTLWAVSRCYEGQESGAPASIKHILDALPPRPPRPLTSCEIKRRAAKEQNNNTEEPDGPADMNKLPE